MNMNKDTRSKEFFLFLRRAVFSVSPKAIFTHKPDCFIHFRYVKSLFDELYASLTHLVT